MTASIPERIGTRFGLLLVMSAAVLWGTVGITTKALYSSDITTPISIGFFRLSIATPVLWVVGWRILKWRMFYISARDLGLMAVVGVLMAFYQASYYTAIQSLGASTAALITLCTAPAMVAIISTTLTKEKLTAQILIAMACALTGTVLLVQLQPGNASLETNLKGVGWALGSALGYSSVLIISRNLASRYHPIQPFAIGIGFGALTLFIFAGVNGLALGYSPMGWSLLIYLAFVPTAFAFSLFLTGIRHTTATAASIATLLEPLTSTMLAWLFFNEQLGSLGVVGAVLLFGAMFLLWRK